MGACARVCPSPSSLRETSDTESLVCRDGAEGVASMERSDEEEAEAVIAYVCFCDPREAGGLLRPSAVKEPRRPNCARDAETTILLDVVSSNSNSPSSSCLLCSPAHFAIEKQNNTFPY